MLLHKVLVVLFGSASALAGAFGLMLLVLWAFDSHGLADSLPELIGGVVAMAASLACHLMRGWLHAREAVEPGLRERAI